MKKIKVFLDDIRTPFMSHHNGKGLGAEFTNDWVIARDFDEFVNIIDNNFDNINLISFDHDLACFDENGEELTGKTAVNYVIDYCLDNDKKFPDWYAHTDNTNGKENIVGAIINFLNKVENKDISEFRNYHKGIVLNKFRS